MKTCILISESYPYDGARELTFLDPEVSVLSTLFNLHIIPVSMQGKLSANLNNIHVVEDFARHKFFFKMAYYSLLCLLQKELWASLFGFILRKNNLKYIVHVILYYSKACLFRDFIVKYMRKNNIRDVIIISFWFSHYSFGAGMLKSIKDNLLVVTRAHGYDLYEERWSSKKIPFRRHAISLIDAIFPDSEAGLKYLKMKYPEHSAKYYVGRLGTQSHGIVSQPSLDGVIRIVTCAYLVPVKRIHLVASALLDVSRRYPGQSVDWTHFGDGPERHLVESFIAEITSPDIKCHLFGEVSNEDIFSHYANNPVDFYINVSSSEGTPVSIIEAISCGIPPIVTCVGGNVEVVDGSNGVLLDENFSSFELADVLVNSFKDKCLYMRMKELSLMKWRSLYSAETNYGEFYKLLCSLSS